jgi:hypothetical protein
MRRAQPGDSRRSYAFSSRDGGVRSTVVELFIAADPGAPPVGCIVAGDVTVRFAGWLELLALLERLIAAATVDLDRELAPRREVELGEDASDVALDGPS